MNAVIYARYSSDNQREESIEGQLRECKEYADQNGITVVRTYIDRALSAKTDSRPQFQQMIHDSATHTFEAVLVWKLDRFSRNRYDSAHYKRILKNNRVHVVSVTEPISNTPEGIMLESLLEGMAEYYSAELAEKVSRGHKENALKAKFNGGPVPLGYRIDSEHHYQIDPATAPVVQEAFQRYAAGESIRSIIESLNARGIRNSRGNPFTKNSFQTLLKNRRYLGEYRYKDTVIPDAIPAIVDQDCFDAVQRRCEIHRQAPAHNKADVHYLLTTKLFCGKCGTMMAGESGRSHTGTVHCYYKCGTRKRSGKEACSLKPVRKEPLEQFVVKTALEKVLNDRVIDMLADKLLEYQSQENTRLPILQAELKEVKRRIDNLVAAIEQGILTPSTKARMEELEQQREALETGILQEQIEKPPITREQILFWFDQFRHGDPADIAFQEKVIDCFVNSIYLFDDRIVVNFNYQQGGRPVSLEEVLGSFLDGNGAPKTSPHSVSRCGGLLLVCTLGGLEQLRRRPPPAAETGSRSRGSGRRGGGPPKGRRTMRAPQPVQCPRESPRGMRRLAGPDGGSLTESVGLLFCCYSPGRRVGASSGTRTAAAETGSRSRGSGRRGGGPPKGRQPMRAPQPVQCPPSAPAGKKAPAQLCGGLPARSGHRAGLYHLFRPRHQCAGGQCGEQCHHGGVVVCRHPGVQPSGAGRGSQGLRQDR